ncbi:MAG TPA: trifunctional transcriptional regulator/proline dehydrogenase/L-glutamate gamma-semialdehyde dehydrogenase [Acetobacteraceae bacterium]|nr:trifunctional transcriptional regulator/proline dehydrogenase/L-glutamate gamma-semialdehyde dehydrogenase [Acetobacteraceae bacterium]
MLSVFALDAAPETALRAAITAAYRRPEPDCLPPLIDAASLPPEQAAQAQATARRLVVALRAKSRGSGVEALMQEFALSSQEGVALMCLAEALLRIPDRATRDALIRDKIGGGDWRAHLGHSPSLFVNAATWGLVVTGRLTGTADETGLSAALIRLIARGGEPLIRAGVDLAMRLLGEQFVMGETIAAALARAKPMEAKGFRYSYDMLGEAAVTAQDAARYLADYERAIGAIGAHSGGRGLYEGPGISIKLSALHPRYTRAQKRRVMEELFPRLLHLATLARGHDIGLNIDAEEAERLDLSLDLLEALCHAPTLDGWNGIGFVVQAYQKRAFYVLDWIIELARRSRHRLMLRLVKGAYWDSEIKRAQADGQDDFPVFTRKVHTDVSYLACAAKLLGATDAVFPQFATHNAQTLAALLARAGPEFHIGRYEFQCLHGMGEPLYEEVVGADKLDRPCRIYAPVGTHETLLAYLVRRLLENGANSSFVHRIGDARTPIEALIADPVAEARRIAPFGAPHPRITLPRDLFQPERPNSRGLDLTNEATLAALAAELEAGSVPRTAAPTIGRRGAAREVRNPANRREVVGQVIEATQAVIADTVAEAEAAAAGWWSLPPGERAARLRRAADLMEARPAPLLATIVREAGRTLQAAISEVREAVDFLRYYAAQVERTFDNATHSPLGLVACISPWNFPLSIFTGQIAAALAAGNAVLAKPAEETPLVAALAVDLLHEAGVPRSALQLLPGDGAVGAALVADARIGGVMFTGSTEVARQIARELAQRLSPAGKPIPLIAETGGQNALVVDSSALAEQVVIDALTSAFDSAGQRCSALRVLCVQEDVADRIFAMLRAALAELAVGNPARFATDIGPVISEDARRILQEHIAAMRASGHAVHSHELPAACAHGTFVPPTLIEIGAVAELKREVFGPVLHLLRFRREERDALIEQINATGYALTFGVHSRIDETIVQVTSRAAAGNIYVNRNLIGAVVGSQPFGGHGMSGTGPKAGGPLYLRRLLAACPPEPELPHGVPPPALDSWCRALREHGFTDAAARCALYAERTRLGLRLDLPGPAGEANIYSLHKAGRVLCRAATRFGLLVQIGAALATGNTPIVPDAALLPAALRQHVGSDAPAACAAILFEGEADGVRALNRTAETIPRVFAVTPEALRSGADDYPLEFLLTERATSINTAAAGGNASLMALE